MFGLKTKVNSQVTWPDAKNKFGHMCVPQYSTLDLRSEELSGTNVKLHLEQQFKTVTD